MQSSPARLAILGSTGSIGVSALDVARNFPERLRVQVLAGHSNVRKLAEQCWEFHPPFAVITDPKATDNRDAFPDDTEVLLGEDAAAKLVQSAEVDTVLSAVVGAAGLRGTWAAVEAGKTVAIANKESLVVAGPLITSLARKTAATLLPVDSEHSAIFQTLTGHTASNLSKVVLTGSGGPFRTRRDLSDVTVEEALNHPTWKMGAKISIDSATLMNKALEVIEARWLFDLAAEQIDVVIHPESIVHSFVEYLDGSVLAQLSPPDMRLPIQIALLHPHRLPGPAKRLNWSELKSLHFEPPDRDRFPALNSGFEVAEQGGSTGAVLNAANEIAVAAFLDGRLSFTDIALCSRAVLGQHAYDALPGLAELLAHDNWARQEADRWIRTHRRTTRTP